MVEASEAASMLTGKSCESEGYRKRAVQLYMSTAGVSGRSLKMIYNSITPAFFYFHTPHNPHIYSVFKWLGWVVGPSIQPDVCCGDSMRKRDAAAAGMVNPDG